MSYSEEYYYNEHDENQVKKILKNKKKKRMKRKINIILIFLVMILISSYFISDYSKVQSIEVNGNDHIETKLILENISINDDSIYLFIDKKNTEKEIKKLGLVKKTKVSCDLFGHVSIDIEEAEAVAYCTIDKKTYVIDELGKVSKTNDKKLIEELKTTPRIVDFPDLKFLKTFAKEYVKIPELIKNKTSDISYAPKKYDETRIEFLMVDGRKLYLRVEDMVEQLEVFDYEANIETYKDKCIFSFEGKGKIYALPCE